MKKYLLFLLITAVLLPTIVAAESNLSDINEHWAKGYIESLVDEGIINGFPDGSFKPDEKILRDAFIKMVIEALGYDLEHGKDYWAENYINKAVELNLMALDEFDSFTEPIKREEMASIIQNAVYLKEPRNYEIEYSDVRSSIRDYEDISDIYKQAVVESYKIGIITGKGEGLFDPQGTATRAEAATVIMRQIESSLRSPFVPKFNKPVVDAKTHYFKCEYERSEEYSRVIEINDNNKEAIGLIKELMKIRDNKLRTNDKGYFITFETNKDGTNFGNSYFRTYEDSRAEDFIELISNKIFTFQARAVSTGVSNTEHMNTSNHTYNIFIGSNAEKDRYDELMEYHRDTFETIFNYLFVEHSDLVMDIMKDTMYKTLNEDGFLINKAILNGRKVVFEKASNGMDIYISSGDNSTVYNTKYSDITGKKAYDFTLDKLTGGSVSLSDYKGKKVLLTFFTTWCPGCIEEMPIIEQISKDTDDIEILAVNVGESKNTINSFMMEHNITIPVLLDIKDTAEAYLANKIPASFFIDEDGYVYTFHKGKLTYIEVMNIIEQMK